MEYLPKKKKQLAMMQQEKEEKLKSFREYLADNDVVLAIVKFLLAARKETPWVEDPLVYLHDYFGNYRDPSWDQFEGMQEENTKMAEETIPSLENKIKELESELKITKKQNRAYKVYTALDPEASDQVGTKAIVAKLSGNAKFDTDTKMSKLQFYYLILHIIDNSEDDEQFEKFMTYFERSTAEEQPPFAGDLENEDYVMICDKIRTFEPPELNQEPAEDQQDAKAD